MTVVSGPSLDIVRPIKPWHPRTSAHGMTFGLGPAGYDVRLAEDVTMHPGDFVIVSTMEAFDMPLNMIAFVHDKSTLARRGLALQNTVIEPGWRGFLTLEISNNVKVMPLDPSPYHMDDPTPILLKRGMPIAQIIFHYLDVAIGKAYDGRYQDQPAGPQRALFLKEYDDKTTVTEGVS